MAKDINVENSQKLGNVEIVYIITINNTQ